MTGFEIIFGGIAIAEVIFIWFISRELIALRDLNKSYRLDRDDGWDTAYHWRNALSVLVQHLRRGGSIAIIGCFGADTHALIKKHEEELGIRHD
jgi:hypothetical protein